MITDPDRKIKFNVGGTPNIASWVALIDPNLTLNLPPGVTAGTVNRLFSEKRVVELINVALFEVFETEIGPEKTR